MEYISIRSSEKDFITSREAARTVIELLLSLMAYLEPYRTRFGSLSWLRILLTYVIHLYGVLLVEWP